MTRTAGAAAAALLAAIPAVRAAAAEYVPPPILPVVSAWQGRAAAVIRILDKLDAHVETLTLQAGETGTYKSLGVTVRSCMDRPDGLPADSAAFLTVQDHHGEVPPFNGWTFAREPAIGVFESPIYGVQLAACDGAPVAPAAPPLPPQVPPPASLAPDEATTAGTGGSSTSVDAGASEDAPDKNGGPVPTDVTPGAAGHPGPPPFGTQRLGAPPTDATPDNDPGAQPDPVYPDGAPPPASQPVTPPP